MTISIQLPLLDDSNVFLSILKIMIAVEVYNVEVIFFSGQQLQCLVVDPNGALRSLVSADNIIGYLYQQYIQKCDQTMISFSTGFTVALAMLSLSDENQLITAIHMIKNWINDNKGNTESYINPIEISLFSILYLFKINKNQNDLEWDSQLIQWLDTFSRKNSVCNGIHKATAFMEKTLVFPPHENLNWFKAFLDSDRRLRSTVNIFFHEKKKCLPKEGQRNILITSALPYVNNVPHLGNIVGSVLSADVFSRYNKARSINTLFVCGTDEYGTATETKALEKNITPQELCDEYHKIHSEIYKWFEIEFDIFGRTTTQKQTEIASDIFMDLYNNGFLEEKTIRQLYCEKHQGFLADRYVQGLCPKCSYNGARGDQCDSCGCLLDPFELKEPKCKQDGEKPIERETRHIFMSLNKLQSEVEKWVKESSEVGKWTANGISITSNFLKMGLEPRCITRDLKWGTPVPAGVTDLQGKVFYVWFDATIGYISITANYIDEWSEWWKNPDHVQLYQFMGKDNVPFHTIIFPASLIGTRKKWTMLYHLNTTEYLKYEDGKFSKSRGVGVFGNDVQNLNVSSSVWRYYLLISRPESSDTVFSWNEFIQRNNSELLANLGNFVNRVVKFINMKYKDIIPNYIEYHDESKDGINFIELKRDINRILKHYIESMDAVKIRYSLRLVLEFSARGNLFLQNNKLNNKLFDNNPQMCADVIGYMINLVYLISACIAPFMPSKAKCIIEQLNVPEKCISNTWNFDILPGHKINKSQYLFIKIDEKMGEIWRNQFKGFTL
ncbi:hypothetical protein PCANB_000490 [Pneumocystis canis]|nr:hypothetical protein PCK1_000483 [Pneumocystis canis]KAG5437777.1 hypothetical protein PCANB_000490 [Pneumocystis canis]